MEWEGLRGKRGQEKGRDEEREGVKGGRRENEGENNAMVVRGQMLLGVGARAPLNTLNT